MRKKDVIKYFGGPSNVARALGIEPPAVSQWGPLIPEKRAARLAKLTKGKEQNGVVLKYDPADYDRKDDHAA